MTGNPKFMRGPGVEVSVCQGTWSAQIKGGQPGGKMKVPSPRQGGVHDNQVLR